MVDDTKDYSDPPTDAEVAAEPDVSILRNWLELLFLLSTGRRSGKVVIGEPGQELEFLFCHGFLETMESIHRPGLLPHLLTGIRRQLDKRIHLLSDDIKLDGERFVTELEETGAISREEVANLCAPHIRDAFASFRGSPQETLQFTAIDFPNPESSPDGIADPQPIGLHIAFEPMLAEIYGETHAFGLGATVLPSPETVVIRTGGRVTADYPELQEAIHRMANGEHSIEDIQNHFQVDPLTFSFHLLCLRARGHLIEAGPERLAVLAGKAKAEGRLDLAIRFYEKTKSCGADDPSIYRELGQIYEIMGKRVEAAENHLVVARSLNEQGQLEDAARLYENVLEVDPHCAEALTCVVDFAFNGGDQATVVRHCTTLVQLAGRTGEWRLGHRARRTLIESGVAEERVLDEFFDGVRRENDRDRAVADLRFLYRHLVEAGHEDRAREVLGRLLAIDGGLMEERFDLAVLLLDSGRGDEGRRELVALHESLLSAGPEEQTPRWELLKKVCEVRVQVEPDNADARLWLAEACRVCLEDEPARQHLEWVVQDYGGRGEFAALAEYLRGMVEKEPDSLDLLRRLASALEHAGEPAEAARIHVEFAHRAETNGAGDLALQAYQHVLNFQPLNPEANRRLAEFCLSRGDTDGVVHHLRKVAISKTANGRLFEAMAVYRNLLELRPEDPAFHLELCEVISWSGQTDGLPDALAQASHAAHRAENYGLHRELTGRLAEVSPNHPAISELEALRQSTVQPVLHANSANRPAVSDSSPAKATEEGFVSVNLNSVRERPPELELELELELEKEKESKETKVRASAATFDERTPASNDTNSNSRSELDEKDDFRSPAEAESDGGSGDQFSSIVQALKAVQGGGAAKQKVSPVAKKSLEKDAADAVGFRKVSDSGSINSIVDNLKALKEKS